MVWNKSQEKVRDLVGKGWKIEKEDLKFGLDRCSIYFCTYLRCEKLMRLWRSKYTLHLAATSPLFQKEPGLWECYRGTTGSGSPDDIASNCHSLCCFVHVHVIVPILIFISLWKDVALTPAPCKTYRTPRLLPKKRVQYEQTQIIPLLYLAIGHCKSKGQIIPRLDESDLTWHP